MVNNKIRRSNGEKTFNVFNIVILSLVALSTLYPFLYVLFASFSNGSQLLQHKGALLWFQGFSTAAYNRVFSTETVFIGFKNTLFYLIVGVIGNMFFTILGAYALSRKGVMLSRPITLLLTFTMYFFKVRRAKRRRSSSFRGSYPSASISRIQAGQQHCPWVIMSKNMPSASGNRRAASSVRRQR